MLAQEEALIRGVDLEGLLIYNNFIVVIEQAADVFVHGLDATEIVLQIALIIPACPVLACQIGLLECFVAWAEVSIQDLELFWCELAGKLKHQAAGAHVVGNAHFVSGGCFLAGVVIKERRGFGYLDVLQVFEVSERGFPRAVRCLVVAHEKEGLVLIALFQPFQGLVCDNVGRVAGMFYILAVGEKDGIVIAALSFKHLEMIESGRRRLEMPFANDGRLVTGLPQQLGNGLL